MNAPNQNELQRRKILKEFKLHEKTAHPALVVKPPSPKLACFIEKRAGIESDTCCADIYILIQRENNIESQLHSAYQIPNSIDSLAQFVNTIKSQHSLSVLPCFFTSPENVKSLI